MTNIKRFSIKKVLSVVLAVMSLISCFSFAQLDAQAASWTTGRFAGKYYTAGTRVNLANRKKDAYVHLYTYKKNYKGEGKNCESKIEIIMKDTNGRTVWSGTKTVGKNGVKLKLGKDHSAYILYFRIKSPGDVLKNPDDYNPKYKIPDYWGLKYTTNCCK